MPEQPVTIFSPPRNPPVNNAPAQPVHHSAPSPTPVEGRRSDPPVAPWQARWQADQDRLTAEDPFRRQDVVISKGEDGRLAVRPRTDRAASTAPADARAQPGQQQTTPQAQPSATSDGNVLRVGSYELSESDIASLMAEKSQRDSRAALMPATAADFKLDLPSDFQLPAGTSEFAWDLETPHAAAQLGALKNWAHANQLDQNSFSQLLSIYAGHMVSEQQRFAAAQKAEIGKLGANAPTRVDAVNTWLESRVGSELAAALRTSMFTSKSVEAYEALMRGYISQGISGNPAASRDGEHGRGPQKVDEATYQKMTYTERQAYAQQFDQSKFR
jgi:hypothetical protein